MRAAGCGVKVESDPELECVVGLEPTLPQWRREREKFKKFDVFAIIGFAKYVLSTYHLREKNLLSLKCDLRGNER